MGLEKVRVTCRVEVTLCAAHTLCTAYSTQHPKAGSFCVFLLVHGCPQLSHYSSVGACCRSSACADAVEWPLGSEAPVTLQAVTLLQYPAANTPPRYSLTPPPPPPHPTTHTQVGVVLPQPEWAGCLRPGPGQVWPAAAVQPQPGGCAGHTAGRGGGVARLHSTHGEGGGCQGP
jgi:hypothetical protein